jgi:hypothetical protein
MILFLIIWMKNEAMRQLFSLFLSLIVEYSLTWQYHLITRDRQHTTILFQSPLSLTGAGADGFFFETSCAFGHLMKLLK